MPSEGEVLLPARPITEHITTLGAAVAAQTVDRQTHVVKTRRLHLAAVQQPSIEHSLGEISNGQVDQPPTYSAHVDRQLPVETVLLDEPNQQPMRPALVQAAASADNGLSLGNN